MAHAMVAGKKHEVRVVQDLTDNWSVEVYPPPAPGQIKVSEPFKAWPSPLILKLRADTKEDALVFGLEHLQKLGRIESFHVEPGERPVPPVPKAGAVKKKDDAEEADEDTVAE